VTYLWESQSQKYLRKNREWTKDGRREGDRKGKDEERRVEATRRKGWRKERTPYIL